MTTGWKERQNDLANFHYEPFIGHVVNVEGRLQSELLMPDQLDSRQFRFDFNSQHGILLSE